MRKILVSLVSILVVGVVAVNATTAVFSDTETSDNNLFTAGTLDLKVDNQDDPLVVHVALANMKPGDSTSYQWTLSNAGSLPGKPWIEFNDLKNHDNSCNDPETASPDTTCSNPGLGEGELGDNLYVQLNAPGSVGYVYPHGPCISGGKECTINYWSSLGHIDQVIDGQVWDTIAGGTTLGGPMVLEVRIPSTVGNVIQSDSVQFDIIFHLEQV